MPRRSVNKFKPRLERVEDRQLLSGGGAAASGAGLRASVRSPAHATGANVGSGASAQASAAQSGPARLPTRFYGFRITNPKTTKVNLTPPFLQTLVQAAQPVPGQIYNLNYVVVKNGTGQTLTASNDFMVRLTNQGKIDGFPVLTGTEQWKPGKWLVLYVLTPRYYSFSFVPGGFQLNLGGASTTLVPGPSSIFLRLPYNPATFSRTLNHIVAFGQGAQLGRGAAIGMPDTAVNEIVAGRTFRTDYGGHF